MRILDKREPFIDDIVTGKIIDVKTYKNLPDGQTCVHADIDSGYTMYLNPEDIKRIIESLGLIMSEKDAVPH